MYPPTNKLIQTCNEDKSDCIEKTGSLSAKPKDTFTTLEDKIESDAEKA